MPVTGASGTWLGPLTTAWSIPDSCSLHVVGCETCDGAFRGQQCAIKDEKAAPMDNTSCWPPVRRGAGTPAAPFAGWGFYSPGLACPTGYTSACTAEYGRRQDWDLQFTLVEGETAVGCCPTGFKCTNLNGNTCIATETGVTVSTARCSGTDMVNFGTSTYPVFVDFTTTVTEDTETGGRGTTALPTTAQVVLLAQMFQLNYQSSDLALASSTTPPTTQSSASETAFSSASESADSGSASDSSPPAAEEGGLSTGAVVGIAVGAALAGILLGVLAIIMCMRNRKRKRAEGAAWQDTQAAEQSHDDYKYTVEMPPGADQQGYSGVANQPHYQPQYAEMSNPGV
ncbi:uncharacterized protein B0H64DRAFT_372513 [Chaetomium fimeti]|uniref:Mid2 domain-containing protein n=1 Tax=Chaetomium fimeti TaxID=1854472 RepID=A0AAE0HIB8_9PEZI|nr:hypothetical protein B0H64DRAFT_372513 [Chaetomium fimeti]